MKTTVPTIKTKSPWWLEEGTEICPACDHAYVYQTEFWCVCCDGPICGFCVAQTLELEPACPGCVSVQAET